MVRSLFMPKEMFDVTPWDMADGFQRRNEQSDDEVHVPLRDLQELAIDP
jgi:hypothetical protein